ncbi:MAG: hypothetical protein AAF604_10310 [Acidobacteriota bacterium]
MAVVAQHVEEHPLDGAELKNVGLRLRNSRYTLRLRLGHSAHRQTGQRDDEKLDIPA